MYVANKSGPSILPCGTPEETGRKFEFALFIYANTLATDSLETISVSCHRYQMELTGRLLNQ